MDNKGTAQDALGTEQLHERVLLGANSVALSVGGEVTQVTDVTVGVFRSTVRLAVRVDYRSLLVLGLKSNRSVGQQKVKQNIQ